MIWLGRLGMWINRKKASSGGGTPDLALVQRDGAFILDRAGNYIVTRA